MKVIVIMACVLVSLIGTATVNAKPSLKLNIEQNGKIVKPDSKGVIYLSRSTFTIVFVFKGSTGPPVKLNLSLNRGNYDGIRSGKKIDTFFLGGLGMAEPPPPAVSDWLVVFGKTHPSGYPEAMHYLIRERFHNCTTKKNRTICRRKVEKLHLMEDYRSLQSRELAPKDFPSQPVYISSAIIKSPHPNTTDRRKMSYLGRATAIIQFR